MLQTLFSAQRPQFDALANAWLRSGATAVSVWSQEGLLDHWPPDSALPTSNFSEPIRMGNQTIGEIRVAGYQDAPAHRQLAFTTMLMSYLTELEVELALARNVQTGFLPLKFPPIPGLQLYGESRAAKQVNGDYYDFIPLSNHQLLFAVGDVVNKGMSAALLMAVMRKVIRTAIKLSDTPAPAAILSYVNTDMYEEFDRSATFATAFVGQFDATHQKLTYVNAGHAPVIYRPAQGKAQLLQAEHFPIGITAQSTYTNGTLHLAADDLLIIATDGLIEASNQAGQFFEIETLLALIDQHSDDSAQNLAAVIYAAVNQFSAAAAPEDDQTVVVLKGTPPRPFSEG
ncbi:MAG: PP2C family protein-serine/threonine phosphatase [Caldilineaceae bacterium]|nr:PP2C family protein-serine/threonine phosphatase [Caldilineaceae bacterium]